MGEKKSKIKDYQFGRKEKTLLRAKVTKLLLVRKTPDGEDGHNIQREPMGAKARRMKGERKKGLTSL